MDVQYSSKKRKIREHSCAPMKMERIDVLLLISCRSIQLVKILNFAIKLTDIVMIINSHYFISGALTRQLKNSPVNDSKFH